VLAALGAFSITSILTMIFITQLIYVKEGQENIFHKFENYAIPIISKYNGELMLRLRPDAGSVVEAAIDHPYEVHIIRFASMLDFDAFLTDSERSKYLDLKEKSIKESFLIKGEAL
jgi:antibiotic biosynthesis monooxygenase (ABM) superfamily enzyme